MDDNKKKFVHFKVHTQYSICEGAIKIEDLAKFCKDKKLNAIGLCDSFNLCGALEFSEEISKAGTQPIIGSQINFNFDGLIGRIPIFAKTEKGFRNLTKLSSKSFLEVEVSEPPHCHIDDLIKNNDDLIVTSGGLDSLFYKLIKKNNPKQIDLLASKIKSIFGNRFYLEIQRHNDNDQKSIENDLLDLSKTKKIPIIASQEVFYIEQDMFEAHDALLCIGQKTYVNDEKRKKYSDQHYIKSTDEINKIYQDIPEALDNNYNFPLRFSYKLEKSAPNLPSIQISSNLTEQEELLRQSKIGLKNRLENFVFKQQKNFDKSKIEKIYTERLNHEINIVNKMNYAGYFLIVSDYIKWAKKK